MLGNVLDCNLNSYETIYEVLKNLLDQAFVGELQKWIRVGFDGVPYRFRIDKFYYSMQKLSRNI